MYQFDNTYIQKIYIYIYIRLPILIYTHTCLYLIACMSVVVVVS